MGVTPKQKQENNHRLGGEGTVKRRMFTGTEVLYYYGWMYSLATRVKDISTEVQIFQESSANFCSEFGVLGNPLIPHSRKVEPFHLPIPHQMKRPQTLSLMPDTRGWEGPGMYVLPVSSWRSGRGSERTPRHCSSTGSGITNSPSAN